MQKIRRNMHIVDTPMKKRDNAGEIVANELDISPAEVVTEKGTQDQCLITPDAGEKADEPTVDQHIEVAIGNDILDGGDDDNGGCDEEEVTTRQKRYADEKTKGDTKSHLGTVLITIGAVLITLGLVLVVAGAFIHPKGSLSWQQTSQYEVPDGMLQDQAGADPTTSIAYIYDVEPDDEPYAVEYHAIARYDSLFAGGERDLYNEISASGNEITFKEWASDNSSVSKGDVNNFRKIDVHLPAEAKKSIDSITQDISAAEQ